MARTVKDAVDQARMLLQDTDTSFQRYSDADLVAYLNNALAEAKRLRPDLFAPSISSASFSYTTTDIGSATALTIDDMYFPAVVDYMAAYAELRDDEAVDTNRAAGLLQLFSVRLRGG